MNRRPALFFALVALVGGLLATSPVASTAAAAPEPDRLDVYVGELTADEITELVALGVDRHDLRFSRIPGEGGPKARVRVEAIISQAQADELATHGVEMMPEEVGGQTAAERATAQAAEGYEVFNTYGGETGLKAEFEQAAADHPRIAKAVTIGQSLNGQDIVAVKVTKNASR